MPRTKKDPSSEAALPKKRAPRTKKVTTTTTPSIKVMTNQGKVSVTLKKYQKRPSPPFPANENCGKTLPGNDGNMYISKPNKNGICSWKKAK